MQTFIGNQYEPLTIAASIGRTAFQTQYAIDIASQPNFDYFNSGVTCDTPYKGPFALLFTTKDGALNCHKVGQKRLLRIIVAH